MTKDFLFSQNLFKLVFVGQAPNEGCDGLPPFCGATGEKIAEWMGVKPPSRLYQELACAVNIFPRWMGRAKGGGDAFPLGEAKIRAAALAALFNAAESRVVLVGKAVARAFNVSETPYFVWTQGIGEMFAVVPHPSGLNRWYNDPDNKARAERWFFILSLQLNRKEAHDAREHDNRTDKPGD